MRDDLLFQEGAVLGGKGDCPCHFEADKTVGCCCPLLQGISAV